MRIVPREKVYINLDPGVPVMCEYCGLKFEMADH